MRTRIGGTETSAAFSLRLLRHPFAGRADVRAVGRRFLEHDGVSGSSVRSERFLDSLRVEQRGGTLEVINKATAAAGYTGSITTASGFGAFEKTVRCRSRVQADGASRTSNM